MENSQNFWPADWSNYGPLFIRLAWHAAGTYRTSDGRGGAEGGRQRYKPEKDWGDNANLDKARDILKNVKEKEFPELSYGDLYIIAGNTAIESMGVKILGFCSGRVDDPDGNASHMLGPNEDQNELFKCEEKMKTDCKAPFGASEVKIIYVNPGGPKAGKGDPEASANSIRNVFYRMNMNDSETVALIGGGHTVGKSHGACPSNGRRILEKYEDAPDMDFDTLRQLEAESCGHLNGSAENTFTSGYELTWTTKPTTYDSEYFQNLLNFKWVKKIGLSGKQHWVIDKNATEIKIPKAPNAHTETEDDLGMFTTDIALMKDPEYKKIVEEYADNTEKFFADFAAAWYKLTTRDVGPRTRCSNDDAPPAQDWQYPLPDPTEVSEATWTAVKTAIKDLLAGDDKDKNGGLLLRLGWQCMSTYRDTDHLGGCNGARILFSPGKDWKVNQGLDAAKQLLEQIKTDHSEVSMADLIVLSSTIALGELADIENMDETFCPGRVDDTSGEAWKFLKPRVNGTEGASLLLVKDYFEVMGLTDKEFVAMTEIGVKYGDVSKKCKGLFCRKKSNSVVKAIEMDDQLSNIMEEFKNREELNKVAKSTWKKIANFDRFDGPEKKLCS